MRRFREASPEERAGWHGLALIVALYLVHTAFFSNWYIEDACITFAFARHAASGFGFVAVPGGEPVEGFSNPSWTLVLTALHLVGINPWIAAKLLGATAGALTLPLAWRWTRHLIPDPRAALLGPLLLAVSPQFVLWNASGLENAFFCLFLTAGTALLLDELEGDGPPHSAWAWALLCITRPEAPLYAAVGGGLALLFQLRRDPRRAVRWALGFAVRLGGVFVLWHAWRFWYFRWEFPNTYYAKLGEDDRFAPLAWDRRGWRYLRDYALGSAQGFLIPVYLLGQTGLSGWRGGVGLAVSALLVLLCIPGLGWPLELVEAMGLGFPYQEPELLIAARVVFLALVAAALPLLGRWVPGRVIGWYLLVTALFFALYSGGDWMAQWRWLSMASVPMAVLFADAVVQIGAYVAGAGLRPVARRPVHQLVVATLLATPLISGVANTTVFLNSTETSPFDVRKRVLYMNGIRQRLHLGPITQMDVDFGAHMWWSGNDLVDMAGLMDVPIARHHWEEPFIEEYVFRERRPDFAHVHGGWAKRTRMRKHRGWRQYIEVPPYPSGRRVQHIGNHIRRDTFVEREWTGTSGRRARFGDLVELAGWEALAPAAADNGLYLELGFIPGPKRRDFRAFVGLFGPDGHTVREIPPGYDWLPPRRWRPKQVVMARHTLPLEGLPPGTYDLVVAVLDDNGLPAAAQDASHEPRWLRGERLWSNAVTIVSPDEAREAADADVERIGALAGQRSCRTAARDWTRRRYAMLRDPHWLNAHDDAMRTALARCYATNDNFRLARAWKPRDPVVDEMGAARAVELVRQGHQEHDAGELDRAHRSWTMALHANPGRTGLRRRVEAMRTVRLGLDQEDAE